MERKNKLKKTIKKEEEEEANKVPLITFTVAAVGECIRTLPFNLLNIFFSPRIKFVLFAVSHCCRISFIYPQWELLVVTHFPQLVVNVFAVTFDTESL